MTDRRVHVGWLVLIGIQTDKGAESLPQPKPSFSGFSYWCVSLLFSFSASPVYVSLLCPPPLKLILDLSSFICLPIINPIHLHFTILNFILLTISFCSTLISAMSVLLCLSCIRRVLYILLKHLSHPEAYIHTCPTCSHGHIYVCLHINCCRDYILW